jgi:hypothetical protein
MLEDKGDVYLAVAQGICFPGQQNEDFDAAKCEEVQ